MKQYLLGISATLLMMSCTATLKDKDEVKPEPTANTSTPVDLSGCYEMIISGDTAFMKIEEKSNSLNGTLVYKRKDKDSNIGIITMTRTGQRAEGYYTFKSEGQSSVRQIVFKLVDNSFAEAYGDIEMKNDTAVFKYPHALNYEEKHAFNKINCK